MSTVISKQISNCLMCFTVCNMGVLLKQTISNCLMCFTGHRRKRQPHYHTKNPSLILQWITRCCNLYDHTKLVLICSAAIYISNESNHEDSRSKVIYKGLSQYTSVWTYNFILLLFVYHSLSVIGGL